MTIPIIEKAFFKAKGLSMAPLLYETDKIYLEKIPFKKLAVNDLVLVKKGGNLFIHRVIYKNKSYLVSKGDNNLVSDGRITRRQIVARVAKIKRNNQIFTPENLYLIQSGHYLKEITAIYRLFDEKNLDYVFLKGLPLHLFYEGKHPKRLYFDCDILIDKKGFPQVRRIFLSRGFRQLKSHPGASEVSFTKTSYGFPINFDVHFEPVFMMTKLGHLEALYPKKSLDNMTKKMVINRKKVRIDNESFFILDPEYLILYLALHFFHHNFTGAFRLEFLDKVIRKSSVSWKSIHEKIKEYRLSNFVAPVFYLLKKYYKTPFPAFIPVIKLRVNIFDSVSRTQSGVTRFKNLFFSSPNPLWRKLLVFFNPEVIYWIKSYFFGVFLRNRRRLL